MLIAIIAGLTIGLEQRSLIVYENSGPVSACVKVLRPSHPSADIGNTPFVIGLVTDFGFGANSKL
jgi:hypothetical protein